MPEISDDDDSAWEKWRSQWRLRADTIYLNHGSFGPPPSPVQNVQRRWKDELERQPMDFFVRQFPGQWHEARARLAEFVGARPADLAFVENSTQGMNVVAHSFPLQSGDEVLLTDHEYGAVERIWQRRCAQAGADLRKVSLPQPVDSVDSVVATVENHLTDRVRLLVVSHITSPTAIVLPVAELCVAARRRGVAICIDGPHAVAQLPLAVSDLGCDFYTASCHKWLSAPFGSGFLYVAPRWQSVITRPELSWGVLRPARPERWDDEFIWTGTRDPSPILTVPAALDFLHHVGCDSFRRRTHWLAAYARRKLLPFAPRPPLVPDDPQWYAAMAHLPLPKVEEPALQQALWTRFGIEVPIVHWSDQSWIRVSCHLYNRQRDIDRLAEALRTLL